MYGLYTEEATGEWIPCNYGKLALFVVLNAHHCDNKSEAGAGRPADLLVT